MNEWMDDLSEDWVSEPRHSSSSRDPSLLSSADSALRLSSHNGTGRRIPSNGSLLYGGLPNKRNSSTASRKVLSERSSNVGSVRIVSPSKEEKRSRRSLTRSMSAGSTTSNELQSSVNRKSASASPPKRRDGDTPEWKRRLLGGNMGMGDSADLFSPNPLEKMFSRPAPASSSPTKEGTRGLSLQGFSAFPSSPPQWPSNLERSLTSPRKRAMDTVRSLAAVQEEEEIQSQHGASIRQHPSITSSRETAIRIPELKAQAQIDNEETDISIPAQDDSRISNGSVRKALARGMKHLRTVSGQSEQVSDFSPVYISKHNTADGKIDYAPLDMSRTELEERLRSWRESQASQQASSSSHGSQRSHSVDDSLFSRLQSDGHELPRDLPAGTPEVEDVGRFVNLQRGGRSEEGSFLRKPLSPSPLRKPTYFSSMEPSVLEVETSLADSSVFIRPTAPTPPHASAQMGPFMATSEHSEANDEASGAQEDLAQSTETDEMTVRQTSVVKQPKFGQGDLDTHAFPEELSSELSDFSHHVDSDQSLLSQSPPPDVMVPGSRQPKRFQMQQDEEVVDTFRGKRKPSKVSVLTATLSVRKRPNKGQPQEEQPVHVESVFAQASQSKRPPNSPSKDPTPKRRRTLMLGEMPMKETEAVPESVDREEFYERSSTSSRKRKDARHGSGALMAQADVLANRRLLRPRNPTPSQRRRQEVEDEILEATRDFLASSPQLSAIQEHLTIPEELLDEPSELDKARVVAGEVAAFSEKVVHGMKDHGRKRSVTTQDFLDEAMKIMDFIRTKKRPGSAGAEPSFLEDVREEEEQPEEFHLTVSRPPSREGGPSVWRGREAKALDPRLLDHLAKYQEDGEDHDFDESIRPLRPQEAKPDYDTADFGTFDFAANPVNMPDIRVQQASRSTTGGQETKQDRPVSSESDDGRPATHRSNTSVDSSVGRTTISRKSENVGTIAPTAVAHLLREQVGPMVFDKDKHQWTRSPKKEKKFLEDIISVSQSEDDPFDDIPDLSIDESLEKRRMTLSAGVSQELEDDFEDSLDLSAMHDSQLPGSSPERTEQARPQDQGSRLHCEESVTAEASPLNRHRQPYQPEVTDPSYLTEEDSVPATDELIWEDVDEEIHINESRIYEQQPRATSISVSLPMNITIAQPVEQSNVTAGGSTQHARTPSRRGRSEKGSMVKRSQRTLHRAVLEQSIRKRQATFLTEIASSPTNQVARLIEENFDTLAEGELTICSQDQSPPALRVHSATLQSSPGRTELTFVLSDLPDFTVNQVDERELPIRTIVKKSKSLQLVQAQEDRFAHGNHALVKALQDVEPQEPYWEHLECIKLSSKGLTSLHILDEMCDSVTHLDVSHNEIAQLSGAPSSIRSLQISHNLLTGLASWCHLSNLQYLDVSNNEIDSMTGFEGLIHLRELKVNNNSIDNLDGVLHLEGLLHLSATGNQLRAVDFASSRLPRLETLDLSRNHLESTAGLSSLKHLEVLRLDDNELTSLLAQDEDDCPSIRHLSMSRNRLRSCHGISNMTPNVIDLNLDGNALESTDGLADLFALQSLSLRSQRIENCDDQQPSSFSLTSLPDVRTLTLSDNHFPHFLPPHEMPSLKHLELATCGVQSLPADFALQMPNLRAINLNFNRLIDIAPLRGCRRLATLMAAGNRITRLRKTAAVCNRLKHLEELDLRDNPVTCGFYHSSASEATDLKSLAVSRHNADAPTPYTLAAQNADAAATHLAKLDDDTKLARRIFELLLANGIEGQFVASQQIRKLKLLDGLPFSATQIQDQQAVQDKVWNRLLDLGIVTKSDRVDSARCSRAGSRPSNRGKAA